MSHHSLTQRSLLACAVWLASTGLDLTAASTPSHPLDEGVLGEAQPLIPRESLWTVWSDGPVYQATLEVALRNPATSSVEGVAYLPIPDAAVEHSFVVDNNGVRMEGQVRSRDRALQRYRRITRQREQPRDPAVLERLDEHWLRVTVAPVAPGGRVTVQVSFLGLAEDLGDTAAIHLPAPRQRGTRGGPIPTELRWQDLAASHYSSLATVNQTVIEEQRQPDQHLLRTRFRASAEGRASLFLDATSVKSRVFCHRTAGSRGYFLAEVAGSAVLSEPLQGVHFIVGMDSELALDRILGGACEALVDQLRRRLGPGSRITRLRTDRWERDPGEWQRTLSQPGVPRLLLLSSRSAVAVPDSILEQLRQHCRSAPQTGLFALGLGHSAGDHHLQRAVRQVGGRTWLAPTTAHLAQIAECVLQSVRHPLLRHPRLELAGASEVTATLTPVMTWGDTLRITGRYPAGGMSWLRLRGQLGETSLDQLLPVAMNDLSSRPWVPRWWAALQAAHIRQQPTPQATELPKNYLTRFCEDYGLLGPETVFLALEPGLAHQMPLLVGPLQAQPEVAELTEPLAARPPMPPPERRGNRNATTAARSLAREQHRAQATRAAAARTAAASSRGRR